MENQITEENPQPRSKKWLWIILFVILTIITIDGYLFWQLKNSSTLSKNKKTSSPDFCAEDQTSLCSLGEKNQPKTKNLKSADWQEQGVAISGKYADADVVKLDDGRYRLYYAIEPEVAGNNLEIFSSISTDGKTWTKEEGARKTMATSPDVTKLANGSWRMYFQNAGVIKSAISADGLTWKDDSGIRVDKNEADFNLENVGAQSTIQLADDTYLMVYRGMINQPYQTTEQIPNKNTQIFLYATSSDGLNWTKKGLALDSRNETLFGLADGAELVQWTDKELRLYFWSYKGIYHLTYQDGQFSSKPSFDFTNNKNSQVKFPPNPPSDPTLIKINDTWQMFYGQHTQGIYYATFN